MNGSAARKLRTITSEIPGEVRASSDIGKEKALGKYAVSFGLSVAITSIFSALLVVVKELNENTILEWMKHVTPHHWITHGIMDILVFVAVGFALSRANGGQGLEVSSRRLNQLIVAAVAISFVFIAGFYLLNF